MKLKELIKQLNSFNGLDDYDVQFYGYFGGKDIYADIDLQLADDEDVLYIVVKEEE